MNAARKFLMVMPAAFGVLVIGSVALAGAMAIAGEGEPELKFVVKGSEAQAHAIAGGKGTARLLLHAATGAEKAAVTELLLAPGASVPMHTHEESAEILYILEGWAIMVVKGRQYEVRAGDAVYIPAGVPHSAAVQGRLVPLKAVQVYVGPGPEQRFRKGELVRME